ncbi:MAG: hypothetical protein L3J63_10890, partial [Geopsychrobacter sp.]|nr:hypothetical protein [Geopsychrobacter sp.]
RVAKQGAQYSEASVAVRQAEEVKLKAQLHLKETRAAKAEIEARLQHQPTSPAIDPAALTLSTSTPPDPTRESALAEALEALKMAEEAYAEADTDLQNGQKQMAGLEIQMQETRSLFDKVKQDPATLDKALEKMAVKETKP